MASESTPPPMTAKQVLHLIAQHLAKTGMAETRFCREAVNDPRLIGDLRDGRQPRRATTARVLACIKRIEAAPAPVVEPSPRPVAARPPATVRLLTLIECYCHATGLGLSAFGELVAGDPSFVARLYRGRRPQERTSERVRNFIASEARA
ncbi:MULTISPECIES: hypothetical protein [unclassified Sphingomonas]|uniref:hypothetical protein n=1 Tax=unclassified Sphingomonas TaxID=196159 RepID=UPI0006F79610|nr:MULTISPECIES: hypothetical protein [unclassified Sphingomonas]KQM64689.1 hypothetical protein ASE65_15580 [Sphingomonas sp. Leaf16]KQN16821.1 hypothetical protein ASE81_15630 [Sphingomonas sp. Leaf29]KQN22804.1 hypothetical protein ASE83_15560 [Sphingomonas sp. Leaf32]